MGVRLSDQEAGNHLRLAHRHGVSTVLCSEKGLTKYSQKDGRRRWRKEGRRDWSGKGRKEGGRKEENKRKFMEQER